MTEKPNDIHDEIAKDLRKLCDDTKQGKLGNNHCVETMIMKRWRWKDGRPIHDADCYIYANKICTCGLLHHLNPRIDTMAKTDWFWDEMGEQQRQFDGIDA